MKLNKEQVREAKNLNKHEMDALMEEHNRIKENIREDLERLEEIRAMMDVATGKMTTKGIDWRAVYDEPYETYSVNARAIYESARDEFDKFGGTVRTVRRFNRYEKV